MLKIRATATLSLLAAVLSLPAVAQANSLWHPAPGEQGFTFHPDHLTSTKTRAEVSRELEQAKADGSYFYLQRGLPVPSRVSGPGKTREEVIKELTTMTPQERMYMNDLYRGS